MALPERVSKAIGELLTTTIRKKLESYNPETRHMPFHHRLLGRNHYALFSFIHSMNTTFGISIWEQVAVVLAEGAGYSAKRQYDLLGAINDRAEKLVSKIHYELRKGVRIADKKEETEQIRKVITRGKAIRDTDSRVDLYVKIGKQENYFDITSAKPNIKEFVALKLKLLRWTALRLSQKRDVAVFTRLAIPYNPYHPEPYERWTLKGLFDLEAGEILVGREFWDFVAGGSVYDELLDLFREVGEQLRPEIDERFKRLRSLND